MAPEQVAELLCAVFADGQVSVSSEDHVHFEATVSSAKFAGKSRVQQQQMVYQVLNPYIANGEIHALALKTTVVQEKK
jgi:acid stress-induced BolA-like protein IbaG/YrbA